MTTELPDPLVPAEVDLRDFQYMELDVRMLRDSRFAAQVSGDAFRAGVLLWCASWHQLPAGSLPDDDIELANLAGYGRFVKEWKKVRDEALTLFVKCSDSRLYHQVVAEKANAAWNSRLHYFYDKARDRLRKTNKIRMAEKLDALKELTFEDWNSRRISVGIPPERADASAGIPENAPKEKPGIPSENGLKGNVDGEGEGEGDCKPVSTSPTSPSEPIGSDGKPSNGGGQKLTDPDEIIFGYGVPLLVQAGSTDKHARSFLGGLRKNHGDHALIDKLRECLRERPLQPLEWLAAALPPKGAKNGPKAENFAATDYGTGGRL